MPQTKQQLRNIIAAQRKALDLKWLKTASAQVVKNLQTMDLFQTSETVALYMAIRGEVQLESLFSACWKAGKKTCIPVFNTEFNHYEMAEINADTVFKTGNYGIQEPVAPTLVALDRIDLIAVPGVAFNRSGQRLGRGGGYYDRMLHGFSGFTIGVAFDFQLLEHIPTEPHDLPVEGLVTEAQIVEVCNER